MNRDEMLAEKIDTQKELLTFEAVNGRPVSKIDLKKKDFNQLNIFKQSKLEKDLMRPLYDHYRKVKRSLSKMNNVSRGNLLIQKHLKYFYLNIFRKFQVLLVKMIIKRNII
jgi:hypothetical protein